MDHQRNWWSQRWQRHSGYHDHVRAPDLVGHGQGQERLEEASVVKRMLKIPVSSNDKYQEGGEDEERDGLGAKEVID